MSKLGLAFAAVSAFSIATPALAAEVFAGASIHDANLGLTECCGEEGTDIQFGVRSDPLATVLRGELRAYGTGSASTNGGVSFAAAGLALRYPFGDDRFYFQPGLGAAVHNGPTDKFQATNDRVYLGSPVVFELEMTLGWRLNDRWAVEGAWTHLSHAQIAGAQNPGMDDLGLRLTYRW